MSSSAIDLPQATNSYYRRQPENTLLYQLVQKNLHTFYDQAEGRYDNGIPEFVKKEFEEFLRCGILAHGFLRVQCSECHDEKLVAFSCKRRGFCPGCGAKRMAECAAHLVDEVLPHRPYRQWVISFPFELRFLLAQESKALSGVLGIINRAIYGYLIKKRGFKVDEAKTGSITFIQRFGSSLNFNLHLHSLVLDGVYTFADGKPQFWYTGEPNQAELEDLLQKIITRIFRYLEKNKLVYRDEQDQLQLSATGESVMADLQSSSINYRIAVGKRKGEKVTTLRTILPEQRTTKLLAKSSGFSIHAGTSCRANDRKKLERICRYISRPSLSEERLSENSNNEVVYRLKRPFDNGTTHVVFDPVDFISKLAVLVPKPRVNLVRFSGIFAPNFKYRDQITPFVVKADEPKTKKKKSYAMSWACCLKRVFDIDITVCTKCGGEVKVLSSIEDPPVIKKILQHLGLNHKPPPVFPSRFHKMERDGGSYEYAQEFPQY